MIRQVEARRECDNVAEVVPANQAPSAGDVGFFADRQELVKVTRGELYIDKAQSCEIFHFSEGVTCVSVQRQDVP